MTHVGMTTGQVWVGWIKNLTRRKIESGEKLHPHPLGFGCPSGLLMARPNLA
jgi:hypothetical protein